MSHRSNAWRPWATGYASIVAGTVSLAGVPGVAVGGSASVILMALTGLCQVLWGTAYILRQSAGAVWLGVAIQAAALVAAVLGAVPVPATGIAVATSVTALRVAAGLTGLVLLAAQHAAGPAVQSLRTPGTLARLAAATVGSAALLSLLWIAIAPLTLPLPLTPATAQPGAVGTPSADAEPHAGGDEAHQATFRVRLSGERAGAYVVDAFTGPTEVGDLFVEFRVADASGAAQDGLTVRVQASPAEGEASPVVGGASADLAQVPGDYAVSLPVPSAGFWNVTATIEGPEGQASVGFSERVGGTANVAGWVLAGVPLVIAALFGLLFLRTAGRGRG